MNELVRLIQGHLDRYGVTRAAFARRCGTTPQTMQNWWGPMAALPMAKHLRGVAEVTGIPYLTVLDAALVDVGYRDSMVDDLPALKDQLGRAGQDPVVLRELAAFVADMAVSAAAERPASDDVESRSAGQVIADLLMGDVDRDNGDNGGQSAR